MMDSSSKNFFLGIEVFKLFCGCCLWFGSNVIWVLWIVGVPPAEIVVVDWDFSFPVGIESFIVVLSEFYPEIVISFCDEFYREFSLSWFIDVVACAWVGPSFDERVFLKVCVSFNVCRKVVCLSSVDCLLCVGEFSNKSDTHHGECVSDPVLQGSIGKPDLCYNR